MIGLKTIHKKGIYLKTGFVFIFMAAIVYAARPAVSDDFADRRITTGAKIFRALLAADVDIARKTSSDGNLRLCLLYIDDASNAEKAADTLGHRDDSRIRKIKAVVEVLPYAKCVDDNSENFAGIFLTQNLSDDKLKSLIDYSREQNIVVFSPFEGDVERGVQSGIAIEARVRPYLNTNALRSADVKLKSFFMRVAKQYEK